MTWLDEVTEFFVGPEENEPEAEDERDGFFGVREPK